MQMVSSFTLLVTQIYILHMHMVSLSEFAILCLDSVSLGSLVRIVRVFN